jgi:hypothetical protein
MRSRAAAVSVFFLAVGLFAVPAHAQYGTRPISDPATGEDYHVEISGFLWAPTPDIVITSEALGILGSQIDFVEDLGIEKSTFKQFRAVLRPGRQHKFRFEYTPIRYESSALLRRSIIFNGIEFPVAIPVNTDLNWRAYRFGYEYDFLYRDRGFLGLILEAKYTDVEATLSNVIDTEFVRARAPIPAIGLIGRVYPAANISITGEFSAFKLPDSINEDYGAKFYDFDLYATVNFTDYVGAQGGYRSFNVFYRIDDDEGELNLKGLYFGGVLRF